MIQSITTAFVLKIQWVNWSSLLVNPKETEIMYRPSKYKTFSVEFGGYFKFPNENITKKLSNWKTSEQRRTAEHTHIPHEENREWGRPGHDDCTLSLITSHRRISGYNFLLTLLYAVCIVLHIIVKIVSLVLLWCQNNKCVCIQFKKNENNMLRGKCSVIAYASVVRFVKAHKIAQGKMFPLSTLFQHRWGLYFQGRLQQYCEQHFSVISLNACWVLD